jgi:2-iminobutanoate/2-iminopropanoate deaminase
MRRGYVMPRAAVTTGTIASPVGPFSPAVENAGSLYLSGQVAQDPGSGKLIEGDIAAQTEQILRNATAILQAAGKDLSDVVRVGVFLTDMADLQAMNATYARHFEAPYPARTTVAVSALPLGARIEMDFVTRS